MKVAGRQRAGRALIAACIVASLIAGAARAQDSIVVAAVRTSQPPRIDGMLTDAAWRDAVPESRFTQRDPDEFAAPTQPTEVRVLYDDRALYVGARMYDSAPDSIVGCLVRRDYGIDSDGFWVDLDPNHDHRSGYYFALDPTGSIYDGVLYNDSWEDNTWDGVWDGATSRDSLGWCAEFRIPFSQLRFRKQEPMVWGINFWRWVTRRHETSYLAFAPRNESGFVSRFPHLTGLKDVPSPRYVELLPYARGKGRFRTVDSADPFNDDSEFEATGGVDLKVGLGPNLVLDATGNPDFGQVEVDPAVVNLTDVETYFDEKRPFFIEGAKNFNFGYGGVSSIYDYSWSEPSFFYSRRIGRTPQGYVPFGEYTDVPEGTRILGAAKVSGTAGGGWNIGSLHALTSRERVEVQRSGERYQTDIEPLTYYTVNRAQRELQGGFRGMGTILTGTHRSFDEDALKSQINSDAYTGGLDGWSFLDRDRRYVVSGWAGFSHVRGTKERMIALQRSPWHYFQRPDASHVEVDSQATSLTGLAGRVVLNKEKGNWMVNAGVGVLDPKYDPNDLGFISRSDVINAHAFWGYRWTRRTSWTRYAHLRTVAAANSDFDGNVTTAWVREAMQVETPDFYGISAYLQVSPARTLNNTRTRGGPLTENPPSWAISYSAWSDSRRPVELQATGAYSMTAADDWSFDPGITVRWKPAPNLNVSLGPSLSLSQDAVQWVGSFADPTAESTYGRRYVFAAMEYTELGASLRMNWTFTPRLTLQAYVQPLISSGDYKNFKQLSRSKSYDFEEFPAGDVHYADGLYTVDPDGSGPAEAFTFANPDFSVGSLRANMVLRWEYVAGSTLYLVWTHGRSDYEMNGQFDPGRSTDRLIETDPDDIIMLKATYWLSL